MSEFATVKASKLATGKLAAGKMFEAIEAMERNAHFSGGG